MIRFASALALILTLITYVSTQAGTTGTTVAPTAAPTNTSRPYIQVIGTEIFVNGTKFLARGVGYSPVPPSTDVGKAPQGDYFTGAYSSMWNDRDLPLIRAMNATLIRIWSFDFIENHQAFLDALWNNGDHPIRVMLPFAMSLKVYPDISYPASKQQVLTDWTAFLNRYNRHPAIFAYMIGNELNTVYTEMLPSLFSLATDMIAIRNNLGIDIPITMPLAADTTWEVLLKSYYATVPFDFWSAQIYEYDRLVNVISTFQNWSGKARPLMITEFGVDAFGGIVGNRTVVPTTNFTAQANNLLKFWDYINSQQSFVVGGLIFEWVDEWWKGATVPLTGVLSQSCPNADPTFHAYCGAQQNTTFIYEEWLGLFAQDQPIGQIGANQYCIRPRPAYHVFASLWSSGVNNYTFNPNMTDADLPPGVCATVGLTNALYYLAIPAVLLILFFVILDVWINACDRCRKKKPSKDEVEMISGGVDPLDEGEDEEHAPAADDPKIVNPKILKRLLKGLVTSSFYKYTSNLDAFEIAKMRVNGLIWNRIASSREVCEWNMRNTEKKLSVIASPKPSSRSFIDGEILADIQPEDDVILDMDEHADEHPASRIADLSEGERRLLIRAVTEVHYRYLESYNMWRELIFGAPKALKDQNEDDVCLEHLDELVLWNVVNQSACTIAHAPEKVSQVFHFTKKYLEAHSAKSPETKADDTMIDMDGTSPIQVNEGAKNSAENMVASLHSIFADYYADVRTHKINYDDLNFDGQSKRIKKIDAVNGPSLYEAFLDIMHKDRKKHDEHPAADGEVVDVKGKKKDKKGKKKGKGKGEEEEEKTGDGTSTPTENRLDEASKNADANKATPTSSATTKRAKERPQLNRLVSGIHAPKFKIVHGVNSVRVIARANTVDIEKDTDAYYDKAFKDRKQAHEPHLIPKHFPDRGGILACIVIYGWLIRINTWLMILAQNLVVPVDGTVQQTTVDNGFTRLAFVDSAIAFIVCILRFPVAGVKTIFILDYIKLAYCTAWFGFIAVAQYVMPSIGDSIKLAFAGYNVGLFTLYAVVTIVVALISEIRLNLVTAPLGILGRKEQVQVGKWVRAGVVLGWTVVMVVGFLLNFIAPSFTQQGVIGGNIVFLSWIFGIPFTIFLVIIVLAGLGVGYGLGRLLGYIRTRSINEHDRPVYVNEMHAELRYEYLALVFWLAVWLIQWVVLFRVLMPAVASVTPKMCQCDNVILVTTIAYAQQCSNGSVYICIAGVILMWMSTIIVSFVTINAAYYLVLLVAGLLLAARKRVGSVRTWREVANFFPHIHTKCFGVISQSLQENKYHQFILWGDFIESLYEENLLSIVEKERLSFKGGRRPRFMPPPINGEAKRRITKFCWSLEGMLKSNAKIPLHRRRFAVRSMPSWTVMVPCHSETLVYLQEDLLRPKGNATRISTIEYLVSTFPDEWANFSRQLREENTEDRNPADLMDDFLNSPIYKGDESEEYDNVIPRRGMCTPAEVEDICFWASYRGQTLVRTLKGLVNYRIGLEKLAMMEEGIWSLGLDSVSQKRKIVEIQKMVRDKCQIIIAYQIYSPNLGGLWTAERKKSFNMMLKRFHNFDLVYNHSTDKRSVMLRFNKNGEVHEHVIERPGELVIGEPKAENQHHALAFALHEIIQVNDMNMYNSIENAFKTPFMLNTCFNALEDWKHPSSCVPAHRIVGYPEYTYTRSLSLVGDLMGSAEFCFVTIMQRVLAGLRARAHYGHPDFIDGYWCRTRGGVSKASHLINTNEDIFSGYEIFGRGETIKYVEYLEQEKGRESSFTEAFVFEAKLAKGAAQQLKTPHVYLLNENMPLLQRLSMFYGSLGFYLSTMLMAITVDLYLYTLLLFMASGVTYHTLGLLNAVLAVPWVFQIGYLFALPLLLELTIEQGFWNGLIIFLKRLLFGVIFFVFHVRTKSYFFAQGLLGGKGGYMGTGRGFGLDRRSLKEIYCLHFDSHMNNALLLIVGCCVYAGISGDDTGSVLLRLWNVLLLALSWMFAPLFFNPYPTREGQNADTQSMVEWISSTPEWGRSGLGLLLKANGEATSENDRKKAIARWWSDKESASWKAWFIRMTIDEWETEDKLFMSPLQKIMLIFQKIFFLVWRFGVWILLTIPFFTYRSLYYLAYIILVIVFFAVANIRFRYKHEDLMLIKLSTILLIPPVVTVAAYDNITAKDLFISLILYFIIAYFILSEFVLGILNNIVFKKFQTVDSAKVFPRRIKIPLVFYSIQIIWPFVCVMSLAVFNMACVMFSSSLTTALYNGAVADKWKRSYMQRKQQVLFVDQNSSGSMGSRDSRSDSGAGDFGGRGYGGGGGGGAVSGDVASLLEGVREEMTDNVTSMADRLDDINRKLLLLRKAIQSGGGGGGGPGGAGAVYMSMDQLKEEISNKTKELLENSSMSEGEIEQINIELEKLYDMLDCHPDFIAEKELIAEEKRSKDEPIDKKALEDMLVKYSDANISSDPAIKMRWDTIPVLKLLKISPADVVKKHQNDWKGYTLNQVTAQEMRAIRSNLPKFGRTQLRQLAWKKMLDDRIDEMESGKAVLEPTIKATKKVVINAPSAKKPAPVDPNQMLAELKAKAKNVE